MLLFEDYLVCENDKLQQMLDSQNKKIFYKKDLLTLIDISSKLNELKASGTRSSFKLMSKISLN